MGKKFYYLEQIVSPNTASKGHPVKYFSACYAHSGQQEDLSVGFGQYSTNVVTTVKEELTMVNWMVEFDFGQTVLTPINQDVQVPSGDTH